MVLITDFKKRQNAEGKEFNTLILQGDVELIKSSQTGKFYATAKKTSITSTFDETMCKSLIGKTLPGTIERVPCEPYNYETEGGDVIEVNFSYHYVPEKTSSMEETVFEGQAVMA